MEAVNQASQINERVALYAPSSSVDRTTSPTINWLANLNETINNKLELLSEIINEKDAKNEIK